MNATTTPINATNRRVKLISGRNRALGGAVVEQRENLLRVRFDDGWIEWVRESEVEITV